MMAAAPTSYTDADLKRQESAGVGTLALVSVFEAEYIQGILSLNPILMTSMF